MKHFYLFCLLALWFVSCGRQPEWTSPVNDFEALSAQFATPSKEYGTAPLYVWNTKVSREMIETSMKDMKDKGFGGVFVHPRPGLITEYLSEEWYDLYKYAIETGKKLDMNVWIYDENSYPSGFAGGHVPEQMPESYNQGQSLILQKTATFPDTVPPLFICLKKDSASGIFADITGNMKDELGKQGEYYGFTKGYYGKSPWYGGYSYIDLLCPGVTEKFIEITMEGYRKHFGEEFGKTVPGWFTDEPNINPPGGVKWTPDLFDVFENQWGYDLKESLPSLFEETGDWKKVRHNYWQTLLQLFIDRWAKPCYAYCEENNLKFTGHYWEHGWPAMADGPDNMAMYAWHQQPAIDMLFNQFDEVSPQAQFGNVRAVKELRSVANQLGYNRTLSETYGGGGWDETFRDFKRLGDWEYVLGVNFMNQHIADLSIAGARKYDYPPVFSRHSPWWEYYKTLNVYFARLSMALSSGEQINDILIVEPTTSIWMYYAYGKSHPQYMETGRKFQEFVTSLEKKQIEYDLASENILKDRASVRGKNLAVGNRAYSLVVIPPLTENLNAKTFALLKKYASGDGKIIAYSKPEYMDGVRNDEVRAFFSDAGKVDYIDYSGETATEPLVKATGIKFRPVSGNSLYHQRRIMKDGQLLFLVNSSMTESCKSAVQIEGKDAIELNVIAGEMSDYPETVEKNQIEIACELPPAGSLLLYIFNKKQNGYALPEKVDYAGVIPEISQEIKPLGENVLTIDFCDLKLGSDNFYDMHIYSAADRVFKYHGFRDGNPWNTSVQYKNNTVRRDTFKTGGFIASYKFTVTEQFDFSEMKAVVERPSLYTVRINGRPVLPEPGKWWLDPEMEIIHIGQYVKKGENILSLELSPMKIHAEIEQVFILGNFTVLPAGKGWQIAAPSNGFTPGSWKSQGWPFYAGKVSYIKTFNIKDLNLKYAVSPGEWAGTVGEIVVNGKSAGIIAFEPCLTDVSKWLKEGENRIEVKIVGSNKNLLGPFHNGQKGLVSPWHFRGVKSYPPGKDYLQADYGLMSGFTLKSR
jgi:hypothetical protein